MFKLTIIGITAACVICALTATAEAATQKRITAVKKIGTLIGKGCDNVASVLWRNKGSVAIGTTAVCIVANPEPFIAGATTMAAGASQTVFASYTGTILFCLLIAVLVIAAVRYLWHRVRLWHLVPLVAVGLLLCCNGTAMAGVVDCIAVPFKPPWWSVVDLVILVVLMFL